MRKSIGAFILTLVFFFVLSAPSFAKILPRYSHQKPVVNSKSQSSSTTYVSAKLRADRKALLVTFMNLQGARSVDYTLTYNGSGADQGVTGSVDLTAGSNVDRELVFGTESHGVYTYHTNIKDMHFIVTIVLKTGKVVVKKYLVKV